jgi:hypothetical protein
MIDHSHLSQLPGHSFSESGPTVPKQLNLGAPSMHYDHEEGFCTTIHAYTHMRIHHIHTYHIIILL